MLQNTSVALVLSTFLMVVTAERARSQQPPDAANAELAALRKSAESFVEAFNKGDAAAVAAHWTADGDFVDETGAVFRGRSAIEAQYAKFFAEHPGVKIRLTIDSLRMLNETAAIEDGHSTLDLAPAGVPSVGKYTVVHVKVDGGWLMSTVRETPANAPAAAPSPALQSLAWLIGSWSAEHRGAKTDSACRWVAGASFIERTYTVTTEGKETAAGVQLIGWNPQLDGITSWNFTSDGGHAVGLWTPNGSGWVIQSLGVLADGTPTAAINLLTHLDNDGYAWQSVNRQAGDSPLPDTEEVVLKRIATP